MTDARKSLSTSQRRLPIQPQRSIILTLSASGAHPMETQSEEDIFVPPLCLAERLGPKVQFTILAVFTTAKQSINIRNQFMQTMVGIQSQNPLDLTSESKNAVKIISRAQMLAGQMNKVQSQTEAKLKSVYKTNKRLGNKSKRQYV